jgi:hypothetical protein
MEHAAMVIHRLLEQSAFTPEDIEPIVAAYEDCLRLMALAGAADAVKETIAKCIIEIAQTGVRDPIRMRELALKRYGFTGET